MKKICFLLIAFSYNAHAALYQTTDENGVTLFTDKVSHKNAGKAVHEIKLNKMSVIPSQTGIKSERSIKESVPAYAATNQPLDASEQSTKKTSKTSNQIKRTVYELKLLSPINDTTIRKPAQNIDIIAQVSPQLAKGDSIHLKVNDKVVAKKVSTSVSSSNLNRGPYTISAEVVSNGQVVNRVSSTVYIHQHSVLFNKNKQPKKAKKNFINKLVDAIF